MAVREIKEFLEKNKEYKIFTIEEIKQKFNELDITAIDLGGKDTFIFSDDDIVSFLYTDYDNPIVLKNDVWNKRILYINEQWFLENLEIVKDLLKYIVSNIDRESFEILSTSLIDDEVIDAICLNKKLKNITLAKYDKKPYSLSKKDYLKFKNSVIEFIDTDMVDDELLDNFDDIIGFNKKKNLISIYNYEALQRNKSLYLTKQLKEEEIINLKYLSMSVVLKFTDDSYGNLDSIVNELKKLGKSNKIILNIENKEKLNKFLLESNIEYDNLYVQLGTIEYPINEYLKFEKKLYDMVSGAKNLSPFEKYIYAYNVVKKFKKYKENPEDKSSSRELYSILINDYMVCVGFSEMFGDLLNKLGISNDYLSVVVDISYDDVKVDESNFSEVKEVQYGGHARRYIHIVDEKYGIDGFYVADPTWDNNLEKDYYNNLIMTDRECLNSKRYLKIETYDSSELFDISSLEEYVQKINFLLSRNGSSNTIKDLMYNLLMKIEKIDDKYVNGLREKYNFINKTKFNWPDNIDSLIFELGNYLLSKVNKEVSGKVIMDAVSNVYRNAYGYSEEELEVKMDEIIKCNKEAHSRNFPVRYNIDEDGNKEVIVDVPNKFDIDFDIKKR